LASFGKDAGRGIEVPVVAEVRGEDEVLLLPPVARLLALAQFF
jgi:hypothetical protein